MPNPSIAAGARQQILWIPETTFGTTPASPAMTVLRNTGQSLELSRNGEVSAELRSDQQIHDYRMLNFEGKGDIDIEQLYGDYDFLYEAFLGGTWSAEPLNTPNTLYAGQKKTLNESFGTGTGAQTAFNHTAVNIPVVPNSVSIVAGAVTATDNGAGVLSGAGIASGTINYLTGACSLTYTTAPANALAITMTYRSKSIVKRSFAVEVGFLDIGAYHMYNGVVVDSFSLDIKPKKIVTGKFGVIGQNMTPGVATAAASLVQPTTNGPFDSFSGTIKEGGATIAYVSGVMLSGKRGEEAADAVGSKFMYDHFADKVDITGTVTAWFADNSLLTKFINETESSLDLVLAGTPNNRTLEFNFPRIKYIGGAVAVKNGKAIPQNLKFQALLDDVSGSNLVMTRANV